MQKPNEAPQLPQVDRFADRLLNALANLDRYANGYEKREPAEHSSQPPESGTRDPG